MPFIAPRTADSTQPSANPLATQSPASDRFAYPQSAGSRRYFVLPETEKLVGQTIVLPTGTGVGQEEILEIVDILRCAIGNANALSEYLGPTG